MGLRYNNLRLRSINVKPRNHIAKSAAQGSTIYRRVKPAKLLPHTAHSDCINRNGLTSWAFTRWRDRHTSDKGAHYSVCRPRNDKRLSWPSWLTYSGRLIHISGHPSATDRAWDRESSPVRDWHSTTVPRNQSQKGAIFGVVQPTESLWSQWGYAPKNQ